MDNKALKAQKRKDIKKLKKQQKKAAVKNQKHITDNIVDLLSDQSSEQHEQQPNNNENMVQEDEDANLAEPKKQSQGNVRCWQIAEQRVLFVLRVDQYYKVRVDHQQLNKTQIQRVFSNEEMIVNGRRYDTYQPVQQFILSVVRRSGSQIKKEELTQLQQISQNAKQFISSVDLKKQTIVLCNRKLQFEQSSPPWPNLPSCVEGNDSLMVLGQKNTGKSALSQYLINRGGNENDCVLLDCDIGRNSALEGCISLSCPASSKKIWIGELTPLNNLQTYIRAVRYLFQHYQAHHYTKKLVVNTMGYTTGLGQYLLYEIYQIVKPKSLIVLQSQPGSKYDAMGRIVRTIKKGEYVEKLYISQPEGKVHPTSTVVFSYENAHATSKKVGSRFQKFFECGGKKVIHFTDLMTLISQSRGFAALPEQSLKFIDRKDIPVFQQSRHKKQDLDGVQIVSFRKLEDLESIDMRLIVLGRMVQDFDNDGQSGLFEVQGVGFGYGGFLYSTLKMQGLEGVVSEGIDFEKGFYHLNEKQLIDLELRVGRVPYILVMGKGLGSKGMRNNPSKVL